MAERETTARTEVEIPDGLTASPAGPALTAGARLADTYEARKRTGLEERASRPKRVDPLKQISWLLEFKDEDLGDGRSGKVLVELGRKAARVFGLPRDLMPGDLRTAQERIKEGLTALRQGEVWKHQPTTRPTAVVWPPPRGRAPRGQGGVVLHVSFDSGVIADCFLLSAMRAMDAAGERFRLCREPGCPEFFVARKRQELCGEHAKAEQKKRMDKVAKRRKAERAKRRKRRGRGRAGRGAGKASRAKARRRAR